VDVDGIEAELVSDWDAGVHENQLRLACLDMARKGHNPQLLGRESVYDIAEEVYRWVLKRIPATIRIVAIGDVTTQQPQEDKPMQIRDNEQFDVTIEVDDAKGFALTGDQVSVTSADETVATVVAAADGVTFTIVAGNPGSTVITFDAGADDNGNEVTATEAVDVVPGNVATVRLTEGAAVPQTPAAPTEPGPDATASQSV
jgi:hypothetical protein